MSFSFLQLAVLLFAMAIGAACVWGMIIPRQLTTFVRTFWERKSSMAVAVIARLILGIALIMAAPETRFPLVFKVIGWLALIAALLLPIIGKHRLGLLIAWLDERPVVLIRSWLIFGMIFAAFLIYGAWFPSGPS